MFIGNVFWQYGVHVLDLAPDGPIDAHIDSVSVSIIDFINVNQFY